MPLLTAFLIALLAAAAIGLWPLWVRRRRERIASQPFPPAWRRLLRRHVPLVARLPARQQLRLKGLMQVFLAEKPILGCRGLKVTDEMRVTIAALACLPLLGAARGLYPELRQVLLYPTAFVVDRPVNEGGVLSDHRRVLAGESWSQGQVLLAWDEVRRGASTPGDGHNVVIHEFAHQLDQAGGPANGAPALPTAEAYRRWSTVMQNEFDALRWRLARGEPGLIDAYGATDPAEFFAVVSELFFERPVELAAGHPALYAELRGYYRLDPAGWI
ncbi:zinc-dependent peptidase [Roseateles asaccharophilus]|uniref:Mlc titration factor MtfA (PtsG expression regulator) n=1 Tax=Roseateles asaccharophilus TaxID=582607 RepID=A0ABU2A8Z9_9BURK|nr:zinc-dependent peptidase [Roseateles asaccharophilus]MDR7333639.1 Mlc titration factor MtfA (ptsG expression regulator) [Roseateles asaccharophilus]